MSPLLWACVHVGQNKFIPVEKAEKNLQSLYYGIVIRSYSKSGQPVKCKTHTRTHANSGAHKGTLMEQQLQMKCNETLLLALVPIHFITLWLKILWDNQPNWQIYSGLFFSLSSVCACVELCTLCVQETFVYYESFLSQTPPQPWPQHPADTVYKHVSLLTLSIAVFQTVNIIIGPQTSKDGIEWNGMLP